MDKGEIMIHNNSKDKISIEKNREDKYHHGDLKECLIKAGLKLLVEEGVDNFSLRKTAAMCNVSHAAPYKHFKNKEELIKDLLNIICDGDIILVKASRSLKFEEITKALLEK